MTLSRRQFVLGTAVIGGGTVAGATALRARTASREYADATRALWQLPEPSSPRASELQRAVIAGAVLAPSSHNTQCWRFVTAPAAITIRPDLSRRCPAVDPDDHHLHVSLGCAAENLVQTAAALGFRATQQAESAPGGGYRFALEPTVPVRSALFAAIADRQSTRGEFDGKVISRSDLALLQSAGQGDSTRMLLLTDVPTRAAILELVVSANTLQMQDATFIRELKQWIRFDHREGLETRDGLLSVASGSPSVPRWIGSTMFSAFFNASSENDKYGRQIRSSSGIAVFVSAVGDAAHWFDTGRCYERFALQCTALQIRTAMINQPVEVASVRAQLATHLGLGMLRPDLVVRFGRGPRMPQSLRRPVDAVLDEE